MITRIDYAPYDRFAAFDQGQTAYQRDRYINPYPADSVNAQAWDRGLEYAMRLARGADNV